MADPSKPVRQDSWLTEPKAAPKTPGQADVREALAQDIYIGIGWGEDDPWAAALDRRRRDGMTPYTKGQSLCLYAADRVIARLSALAAPPEGEVGDTAAVDLEIDGARAVADELRTRLQLRYTAPTEDGSRCHLVETHLIDLAAKSLFVLVNRIQRSEALSRQAATRPVGEALADVAAERQRQIDVEGWEPEHDDEHDDGELARAAASYAVGARTLLRGETDERVWPVGWEFKPDVRRRELVKAGALVLAEIERLDRLAALSSTQEQGG